MHPLESVCSYNKSIINHQYVYANMFIIILVRTLFIHMCVQCVVFFIHSRVDSDSAAGTLPMQVCVLNVF